MNGLARFAGASLLGLAALPASAVNLIVNGSFEDPIGTVLVDGGNWTIQGQPLPTGFANWQDGIWYTAGLFERYAPGIEVQTNETLDNIDAQAGSKYIELDGDPSPGDSVIGQFFATTAGTTYQFSFWYSPRTVDALSNAFRVDYGAATEDFGEVAVDFIDGTGTVGTWSLVSYFFTATSERSYIGFAVEPDDDTLGALIDNVSVAAVPVPAAAWLLGSAMVGLFGVSRRRSV